MSKIFISYRRIDSQHITDRIYDKLVNFFGYIHIFKDVDSIAIGKNFMDEIKVSLEQTDIFLLIIGKNWVGKEDDGSVRIDNPNDLVRVELENAIKLELTIIPILVDNASMPNNLPLSIEKIIYINALKVRADPDFNNDIQRLLDILPKKNKNNYFNLWSLLSVSLMILMIYISLPYIRKQVTENTFSKKDEQLLINGCKANKSDDCYSLAMNYRDGIKVTKSLKKAVIYFEKSCELNNKSACTHIGYIYANAEGVVKNTIKAIKLYKKACKLGEAKGCYYLGWEYTHGAPKDRSLLKKYKVGYSRKLRSRKIVYDKDGVSKDRSLAKVYYDKACHLGYQPACDIIKKNEL